MTKDEIIQMAEDCGIVHQYYEIPISRKGIVTVESQTGRLLKFAKLVAELERERIANACENIAEEFAFEPHDPDPMYCAEAIRARGEK
jgi:DNA/RNA-binding domain of Phe-tRNA-synthetase-like protein